MRESIASVEGHSFLGRCKGQRSMLFRRFQPVRPREGQRELRRGGNLVPVEPLVFDLLEFPVRNSSKTLSKDDLIVGVWNRRIVSDSTLSSRMTAVRGAIGDNGKEQRLIRTIGRRGYRFIGTAACEEDLGQQPSHALDHDDALAARRAAASFSASRPAIAVLPFVNAGQDSGLGGFINGIVEDITTALAQFRWLAVSARSSSFAYSGWTVDIKQVGSDLGVHHVLEGSVRQTDSHVRVAARLVDTTTRTYVWVRQFDVWREDLGRLQDQITTSVVDALGPKLEQLEIDRARRKPVESSNSVDYYLRGMGHLYSWNREGISDALRLFKKAIEIDPDFASAYGMAAYCYVQRKSYGWITDRAGENVECERLARRAAELAKDDALPLSKAAHAISSVVGDVDSGAVFIDRALTLNPSLAAGWYVSGWIRLFLGEPDVAIEHLTRAIRHGPCDPLLVKMHVALAYAHFFAGRYDDASRMAATVLRVRPTYLTALRGAAASHALAGRLAESRRLIAHMRSLDPALRVSDLPHLIPFHRSDHFARWAEALQRAGLPA